jgi:histidinol-phosphate phosphatase family protein
MTRNNFHRNRAVILDRDGTIIKDVGHLTKVEQIEILPKVPEIIREINLQGWVVVVVTNQSVVGRGMCTNIDVEIVNDTITSMLLEQGAKIDAFVWCPHLPEDDCWCRKPRPGLLYRIAAAYHLDLRECLMIGDSETDMLAARSALCQFYHVKKNVGLQMSRFYRKAGVMDKIRIGDFQFKEAERAAVQRVMNSGRVSEWRETKAFEEEFADWVGAKHCVATSSGTAALMVGLKALEYLGLAPAGARVLIPALTFVATANAVKACGMEPVFSDIDEHTYTMNAHYIAIHNADVILPVHLFGFGADMKKINGAARWVSHRAAICEDACEAHGTLVGNQKAGSLGTWGAFSFYIAHTIQAGEMGAIVTDNADIARVARQIKAHGRLCSCKVCTRNTTGCHRLKDGDPRFLAQFVGYNFKANEWTTAIARAQLAKASENIARRKANAQTLTNLLLDGQDRFLLPGFRRGDVPMVYPIVLKNGNRDEAIVKLEAAGVEARPAFGCIPLHQPAYAEYKREYTGMLPISEWVGESGFYVGCHQYLTGEQLGRMARVILESV